MINTQAHIKSVNIQTCARLNCYPLLSLLLQHPAGTGRRGGSFCAPASSLAEYQGGPGPAPLEDRGGKPFEFCSRPGVQDEGAGPRLGPRGRPGGGGGGGGPPWAGPLPAPPPGAEGGRRARRGSGTPPGRSIRGSLARHGPSSWGPAAGGRSPSYQQPVLPGAGAMAGAGGARAGARHRDRGTGLSGRRGPVAIPTAGGGRAGHRDRGPAIPGRRRGVATPTAGGGGAADPGPGLPGRPARQTAGRGGAGPPPPPKPTPPPEGA